jgi:molybdenum cofactor biosynthesis enzyme MoaA
MDDTCAPVIALAHLDDLWFQVAGTRCNLACTHCFISCSPYNRSFGFLDLPAVERALEESIALGVKEYYFTGGEPFLHPDMPAILEMTLRYGPATVLTNGTLFKDDALCRLRAAEDASIFSLEFRVSMDGFTPAENDAVRGAGTFERILDGVRQLLARGFLPILTVTRTRDDEDDGRLFTGFVELLRANGYARPRIKILPTLRIGAEVRRHRGYSENERVTRAMMADFDPALLLCNHSRIVTERGVFVCPILIESAGARLGSTLAEALGPARLNQQACHTCYLHGALCANPSGQQRDV